MSQRRPNDIPRSDRDAATGALDRLCRGDQTAHDELSGMVYDDLRRLASGLLRHERRDHTLQPTALVHEVWLRLVNESALPAESTDRARRQFLQHAVQGMRRILIEHARARSRQKRGADRDRVPFSESFSIADAEDPELLDLDAALGELAERMPRAARIAELRIYGGLSTAEAADTLEVSLATAKTDWTLAKALLTQRVRG